MAADKAVAASGADLGESLKKRRGKSRSPARPVQPEDNKKLAKKQV